MKKILYTFLLTSPLLLVSSCKEEAQSGYDCVENICTATFECPQYLTLSDCQSVCVDNSGYNCVENIVWKDCFYRSDIGYRAIKREK